MLVAQDNVSIPCAHQAHRAKWVVKTHQTSIYTPCGLPAQRETLWPVDAIHRFPPPLQARVASVRPRAMD